MPKRKPHAERWWPIIHAISRYDPTKTVKVKVSRRDYALLKRYKWREEAKTGYIYRRSNSRWIAMHRQILGLPPYKKDTMVSQDLRTGRFRRMRRTVDHHNRDIRDNRRSNLKPMIHQANMRKWMLEDGRMTEDAS